VDICPVGALTSKDFRFRIRVWFLTQTKSICPGCARGCNISVDHHDGHVYRLKPRRNDEVNDTWMCDEGRFGYQAINAETRALYPQLRQNDTLTRASWQDALQQGAAALRQYDGDAIGVLVAPQGTNEDCFLLAKLASDLLGTPHVVLFPGAPGYEDDLLLRADRNPNTRGAKDMGLPQPGASGLQALQEAIEQGSVKVLYAIDTDLTAAYGTETASRLARQLDSLILQTSHTRPDFEHAQVVLPSATYAERDGTFTNFQGRIQRINRAIRPLGEARPAWQIYTNLAQTMRYDWTYASAEAVLADIATDISGYAGLSYAKIGDLGSLVTEG
jgi:NADH-quinone oxidoreductase subunit G